MARSSKKRYLNPGFPLGSPILTELEEEAERLGLSMNDVLQIWANDHYEMSLYLRKKGIMGGWQGLIRTSIPTHPTVTHSTSPAVIEQEKTEEQKALERKTQGASRFRDL